jgi:type I restriction enzyme S subunit
MQNLLTGKLRLPGFSGKWENVRLGGLGVFSKGGGISNSDKGSGNTPCLTYGEIYTTHDEYIKTFVSFISTDIAARATRLSYGDLLFTCSGETREEIGKCVAFVDMFEAYAGGDIIILSPKANVYPLFAGFALNSELIVKQRVKYGQGDSIVHISKEWISKIMIMLPSLPEQTAGC